MPPAPAREAGSRASSGDVEVSAIPEGEHRLSRPEDIALILDRLIAGLGA